MLLMDNAKYYCILFDICTAIWCNFSVFGPKQKQYYNLAKVYTNNHPLHPRYIKHVQENNFTSWLTIGYRIEIVESTIICKTIIVLLYRTPFPYWYINTYHLILVPKLSLVSFLLQTVRKNHQHIKRGQKLLIQYFIFPVKVHITQRKLILNLTQKVNLPVGK